MALYNLRPNADLKADWVEEPVGAGWSCIDDAVTQPTVPTLTDYVRSSTPNQISRYSFTTTTLAGGETVAGATLWFYANVPVGAKIEGGLLISGTTVVALFRYDGDGTSRWYPIKLVAPLTQAQVDGIGFHIWPDTGSVGAVTVYGAYIELETSTSIWAAANGVLLANRDPATGLSVAAGFLGGDCFKGVDLGGGVTALMMRDSYKATASGQQQALLTSPHFPASDRTAFLRSGIGILDDYDVESASFAIHSGASNSNYFPNTTHNGVSVVRWPQNAFIRSGRLFAVGVFETSNITPNGRWVAYCDNWGSNPTDPTLWTWTYSATYPMGQQTAALGDLGMWDNSATDGYVYLFDNASQLFTTQRPPSAYRLLAAQFQAATDWTRGEWWSGAGWARDRPGTSFGLNQVRVGRKHFRGGTYSFDLPPDEGFNEGSIYRRSDGKFELVGTFDAPWTWNPLTQLGTPPYHLSYALTPSTAIARFGALAAKYTVPAVEDWIYTCSALPWLTWSGMGADDQVWTYNGNSIDQFGDPGGVVASNAYDTSYYPKLVKATAVT